MAQNEADQGSSQQQDQSDRLCVTTTLFPYYDFVRQIAGDRVKLKLVVPAGMDSHSFEPTPADMITIQNSDIFLYNGGEMEQWVEDALESIGNPELRAVSMMDSVDVLEEEIVEGMEEGAGHDHDHGHSHDDEDDHDHDHHYEPGQVREIEYDEHIWTSPVNAMKIVETISSILIQEDPQHQSFYEENTSRYLTELAALDREFQQVSADRKRDIIIVGDKFPFRYLAEEYDLQYRAAFAGCSSDTEPSARTIAYLIDQVRQQQLPVVYYLELSSHRVAEIIGEETGAVPMLLHSCHNVTRQEFEEGITYLQLMEQNVKNLRAGLAE
ncbi:MAG: metal ABC transporter substrate-binding protein [Lachnospiraceae bacterium]|nr:metal ABC transporter substrate-binding protein [Lachnospiraceae bacterium]